MSGFHEIESHPYASPGAGDASARSLLRSAMFWTPTIVCLLAILLMPVAFFVGAISGNSQIYNNLASRQQERIEDFLNEDPEEFGGLTVRHASNGWAFPEGTVHSQQSFDRLSERLHQMFGDELAERMMTSVEIRE